VLGIYFSYPLYDDEVKVVGEGPPLSIPFKVASLGCYINFKTMIMVEGGGMLSSPYHPLKPKFLQVGKNLYLHLVYLFVDLIIDIEERHLSE
jgi:hypothetical protein